MDSAINFLWMLCPSPWSHSCRWNFQQSANLIIWNSTLNHIEGQCYPLLRISGIEWFAKFPTFASVIVIPSVLIFFVEFHCLQREKRMFMWIFLSDCSWLFLLWGSSHAVKDLDFDSPTYCVAKVRVCPAQLADARNKLFWHNI